MEIKWKQALKRSLILLLAAVVLLGAVPMMNARAVDLDNCSMVVQLSKDQAEEFGEDFPTAEVVVDLYQVATGEPDPAQDDSYRFVLTPAFDSVDLSEDAETIAAAATEIARGNISPVVSGLLEATISVDAGMYLMVVHGAEFTNKADYFRSGDNGVYAIANSAINEYQITPQLISIPYKEGGIAAGSEDWLGDDEALEVNLKVTQNSRLADIAINKTLLDYIPPDQAAFVFHIVADLEGENVYDDYEAIYFSAAGSQSVVVEGIPVGAYVRVEEEYTGATYTMVSGETGPKTLEPNNADGTPATSFSFVNQYDGTVPGGTGMTNHFEYSGTQWTGTQTH